MRRWSNSTEAVEHGDDDDDCYYRSDSAALFVCDDVVSFDEVNHCDKDSLHELNSIIKLLNKPQVFMLIVSFQRGLVKSNDSYYLIHPLPERFHTEDSKAHVLVKRTAPETNNEESCVERDNLNSIAPEPSRIWTKHRRKRDADTPSKTLEEFKLDLNHRNKTIGAFINKLVPKTERQKRAVLPAVFVETAVFIDRDLYKHMTVNFPKDTERELVRFVLAMINAVQLLYHDPSLGRPVNYILKRLEILHEDPSNLKRPHDIDRFLSNFCTWQRLENPQGDSDPLHWDHALILTGLDLYVVSKNGKVSSQVVGELIYVML